VRGALLASVHAGAPWGLALPQSETEGILAEVLAGFGGSVERRTRLTDLRQSGDGVAVVLFVIVTGVYALSTSGHAMPEDTTILSFGLETFLRMGGGGALVGLVLGGAFTVVTRQIDDHLIETTLTTLLAYGSFLVAEQLHCSGVLSTVFAGIVAGSLALLADAGHMLTDCASLALAWMAFRIGRRPHDARRTYGYHRFQVLAAFVNGAALIAVVGWIAIEAARRLLAPAPVEGGLMLLIAALGLLVNIVAFAILHGGDRDNLNVRGAALHVLGDLLGSVAAIVAGAVIFWTGWTPIDPLLSVLVALLILRSAWLLVQKSAHILLEGTPDWLDVEALKADLVAAVPAVQDVHHVHAWMLTSERPLLTLHARVRADADHDQVLKAVQEALAREHGIDHATIQIEPAGCTDEAR